MKEQCKYCQNGIENQNGDIEFEVLPTVKIREGGTLLSVFRIIKHDGNYHLTNTHISRAIRINACPICGRWFKKEK